MKANFISHKSKRILYVDYRGLNTSEMLDQLEYESNLILKEAEPVLYLANFENTVVASDFMNRANELGKKTEKKTAKSAVVGVSGMKKVLMNTYSLFTGSKMKAFNTEEEAKDYLTA
jgi:hypothetical protein